MRILLALVVSSAACASSNHAAAQAQPDLSAPELARRVDSYYNALHSLRANFTETYDGMGISRRESGTLLLGKPGKMRWNYAEPRGKLFLLDGKYAWFYSPGDAQVERRPASQLDDLRSPLRFLLGHARLEHDFENLTLTSTPAGFTLSGVPKGLDKRIQSIVLGVAADGAIQSIAVTESDGSRTAFAFTNQQPNTPVPAGEFVFEPPAGVPVVNGPPPV